MIKAITQRTEYPPNPLREDGLYPVLMTPGVFEGMRTRRGYVTVEWGEPDEHGFYTPTITEHEDPLAL